MWRARASLCFLVSRFMGLQSGWVQLSIICVACVPLPDYISDIPVYAAQWATLLEKTCQWACWPRVNLGCNPCCTCCGYCKEGQAQNWTAVIPLGSLCVVTSSRSSGIANGRHRGLDEILNSLSLSCTIVALNEPLISFALKLLTWQCAHLMWMRTLGLVYWIK